MTAPIFILEWRDAPGVAAVLAAECILVAWAVGGMLWAWWKESRR